MSMPQRQRRTQLYGAPPVQPSAEAPVPETLAAPITDAPVPPGREVLATNTGVRLACTMAAMIGLFAIFLCWAEKESRVIRRFSVQSACLTAVHAAVGAAMLLLGMLLGRIPYVGVVYLLKC